MELISADSQKRSKKILVLDDSQEYLDFLRKVLIGIDANIEFHTSEVCAAKVLSRGGYDLVLIDWKLNSTTADKLLRSCSRSMSKWQSEPISVVLMSSWPFNLLNTNFEKYFKAIGYISKSDSNLNLVRGINYFLYENID